jgi:hypothetical protein
MTASEPPRVEFPNHGTYRYKGVTFKDEDLRRAIHEFCDEAEELLWKELLFCKDNGCLTAIDLEELKYDQEDPSGDHCFPRRDGRPLTVAGGPDAILERASTTPSTRNEITFRPGARYPAFSLAFQLKYQSALHRFLCYIFCLIHSTAGVPMTDKQVLSLRYIDGRRYLSKSLYRQEVGAAG